MGKWRIDQTFRRSGYWDLAVQSLGKEELRRAFLGEQACSRQLMEAKLDHVDQTRFLFPPLLEWSGVWYEGDAVSKATSIHVPSESTVTMGPCVDR